MGILQRFNNRVRGTNLNGDWVPKASFRTESSDDMDNFFGKAIGVAIINFVLIFGFVAGVLYLVKHLFF
jgi:hypothetical protein